MHPAFGYAMMGPRVLARGMGFGGFGIAAFFCFLLLAAVVALVVWLVLRKQRHGMAAPTAPSTLDSALAIARERLARGEIDAEQYTAIVNALNG